MSDHVKAEWLNESRRRRVTSFLAAARRDSLVKPLVLALLVPFIIGTTRPQLLRANMQAFVTGMALLMPICLLMRAFYDWLFGSRPLWLALLRSVHPFPDKIPIGTDLSYRSFPLVTILLVVFNAIIYYRVPYSSAQMGMFMPYGDPSWLQIGLSVFTSAFLHGSQRHLLFNMLFLWIFGNAVEQRVGSVRFAALYMLLVVASNLIMAALFFMHPPEIVQDFSKLHSCGASGAISGVMGLFAVRCFFARIRYTVPFLFIPHLSVPVRMHALVLIGFFFALDVHGYKLLYLGKTHVNYWAHVGGYLAGMAMGYLLGLHREASSDSIGEKARVLARDQFRRVEAAERYREILENDPRDLTALTFLLEYSRTFDEHLAASYYRRLMTVFIDSGMPRAAELYRTSPPIYAGELGGGQLLRLGLHFKRNADLLNARRCLEKATHQDGPWEAKAMLLLSEVFDAMGSCDRCRSILREICRRFPDSGFAREAAGRLGG